LAHIAVIEGSTTWHQTHGDCRHLNRLADRASYAAGMSGKDIRHHVIAFAHDGAIRGAG